MMHFIEMNYWWIGLVGLLGCVCAVINMWSGYRHSRNLLSVLVLHVVFAFVYILGLGGFSIGVIIAIIRYVQRS